MAIEDARNWLEIELKLWESECKSKHPVKEALDMAIKALEQEPCEDAISRDAAIDLIADYELSMDQVVRGIHALPPVTPQPKTGQWIEECILYSRCSECGEHAIIANWSKVLSHYCPNCGAKMIEPQERSE